MKQIVIDEHEKNSLRILIDYLEDSEYKHYEECDSEDKKSHIYNHVAQLKSLLDKAKTEGNAR